MNQTIRYSFFLILALMAFSFDNEAIAQNYYDADQRIILNYDARLDGLLERYNRTFKKRGYRIQIISSSKKDKAKKTHSQFSAAHAKIKVYEIYQQPFFIVKVGDFMTKVEAVKFHRQIKEAFPESFIVPDFITPTDQYTSEN